MNTADGIVRLNLGYRDHCLRELEIITSRALLGCATTDQQVLCLKTIRSWRGETDLLVTTILERIPGVRQCDVRLPEEANQRSIPKTAHAWRFPVRTIFCASMETSHGK